MDENTTPAAPEATVDPAALVGALMGETPAQPEMGAPGGDPLVAELRGEVSPADPGVDPIGDTPESDEVAPEDTDVTGDTLEKLARAQSDAGKAGERLGKERKEWAEERALLEARLNALETGQTPAPQQTADVRPETLDATQVAAFMGSLDDTFESTKDEFVTKAEAASIGVNAAYQALQAMQGQVGGVTGSVHEMQFDQKLGQLGVSRADFNAIWDDPSRAWGQTLSDDQRLEALQTEARTTGSRPSQAAVNTPQAGAPTTSRVDPRKMIETNQGAGSAQNPRRMGLRDLDESIAKGDIGAAKRAAAPLFERFMGM